MRNRKVNEDTQAAETARKAMNKRNKKNVGDPNQPYYIVVGGFVVVMVVIVFMFVLNPKESLLDRQVIDDNEFLVHNLQNPTFQAGPNDQFVGYTMNEARKFFNIGISDSPNLNTCPPIEDVEVPESYDFRTDEERQHCVDTPRQTGNCTAGHVLSVISTVEDRICINGGKDAERFRLSAQDAISCDSNNFNCDGGYVTHALDYGVEQGFVKEECYPYTGQNATCPIEENECRANQEEFKLLTHCVVQGPEEIKKEIIKNGPVIAPLTPFTDFLTYKSGSYYPGEGSFKFNGAQAVKIIGWEQSMVGDVWIIENTWGPSWGEDGYAKVAAGHKDLGLDYIGIAPRPIGMNAADWSVESERLQKQYEEYQAAQEAEKAAAEADSEELELQVEDE